MVTATFDALGYARKLENAGFTREQAEVQAEGLRAIIEERVVTNDHLDARLRETELRLERDIEIVRNEIKSTEIRLIKWQIGGWVALAAIMAKGFGWLGF